VAAFAVAVGTVPPGSHVAAQQPDGLSTQAIAQIRALTAAKTTRTPAQRKMDSQLVYAARMARGEPIAAGVTTLRVNLPDVNERGVVLDVRADVTDSLLNQMRALGAEVLDVSAAHRHVRVRISLGQIEALAALPEVTYLQPKQFFSTRVGSRNSEGDTTHRAAAARATYGVSGAGVKVGVLSDGVTNLAASQAAGDLGQVTVLPGQTGSGDEGTAMLEIIHDLAPNAELYFATAFGSLASFAQNIRDLQAAGCTIIVDDIGYSVESPFQDGQTGTSPTNGGIVTQAVKDVAALGVLYFSAGGNDGNKNDNTSGTWEGDFVDGGAATGPLFGAGRVHNFGGQTFDQVLTNTTNPVVLFWSDPLGASSNDYDLYILNSTGTTVLAASTNVQFGTQDPFEDITGSFAGERIVVVQWSGAARFLHLDTLGNRLQSSTAGNIRGHNATTAPNSFGVAATPAQSPGPFPSSFNGSHKVETFSSDGPRRIFFAGNGAPFTPGNVSSSGGVVLQKPDLTAADGVSITGVGGFSSPFFGTSAAAPHAAAIAALVKSRNLNQTATQVRTALFNSAIDIEAAGVDRDSGVGIIMADVAVASVAPGTQRPGDFDGDGRSDIAVFRPSTGVWYIRGISTITWGGGGDIPVVGDYDGDGKTDIAVYRPSTGAWYIINSSTTIGSVYTWGGGADIPVAADYDGDGKTDIAVYRPSTGAWYIINSSTTIGSVYAWGGGADIPVAADYDGDGKTDIAVFRPSTGAWYIRGYATYMWGGGNDIPVPGDYDGDGKTDIAVFRPSAGVWYIINSSTMIGSVESWGGAGDIPVLRRP